MTAYFLRRFLLIIPTLLGTTLIVFGMTRLLPGGPLERDLMNLRAAASSDSGASGSGVMGSEGVSEEQLEALRRFYDLDKPWYQAYYGWLGKVCTLDFGESKKTGEPVWDMIRRRFPISMTFGLSGFLLAYLICIPLGIFKALKHGSHFDFASSAIVFMGYSIPGFAAGIMLQFVLTSGHPFEVLPMAGLHSESYEDLPWIVQQIEAEEEVSDFGDILWEKMSFISILLDRIYYMILPVFCYTMGSFATLTVLTKNSLLENLGQDYVRTAFAKGLSPRRVIFVHTLRNSLIPLATGLGHAFSLILAGSILIETVFNIPGLGLLSFDALTGYDFVLVMGILVISTALTLFGNILSDILYALIDPRIRFE